MLKRLDNVGIAVANAERSIAFYRDVLGMEAQLWENQGAAGLGDVSLYIFETKQTVSGPGRSPDYFNNPVGLDHLAFEVEDIEAAAAGLVARGVVFLQDTVGEPGAFRYRAFHDPDQNMLYIVQKPAS